MKGPIFLGKSGCLSSLGSRKGFCPRKTLIVYSIQHVCMILVICLKIAYNSYAETLFCTWNATAQLRSKFACKVRMCHRVPGCPLHKEAPNAEAGDAVAALLAGITAGRKEACSGHNLHEKLL